MCNRHTTMWYSKTVAEVGAAKLDFSVLIRCGDCLLWREPGLRQISLSLTIFPGSSEKCLELSEKICNFARIYGLIAKIPAYHMKSGAGNTMVTSDVWQEVDIRPFSACAMKNVQFGPYLWPNRQNSCIIYEIWVGEHDGDVRFLTGSRNKAVLRMRNEKYAIWPVFMAELPKFPRVIGNRGRGTRQWRQIFDRK